MMQFLCIDGDKGENQVCILRIKFEIGENFIFKQAWHSDSNLLLWVFGKKSGKIR